MLARRVQHTRCEFGHRIAKTLAVRRDQIVERIDHPGCLDPRCLNRARLIHTGGDEHRIMAIAQGIERSITTNLKILVEHNAARRQPIDPAHHDGLFQLKARDAVSQQPTRPVVAIVDVDSMPRPAQMLCRCQPGWSRTDDRNRLPGRGAGDQRLDPAIVPRGVGNELLHRANGNCTVPGGLNYAIPLTQPVLRTDASANLGHGRGGVRQLISLAQAPLRRQPQPVGDVIVERAVHRAIGHAALRTARRLRLPRGIGIAISDFAEISRAQLRVALGRIGLRCTHKFQHWFLRHRSCVS